MQFPLSGEKEKRVHPCHFYGRSGERKRGFHDPEEQGHRLFLLDLQGGEEKRSYYLEGGAVPTLSILKEKEKDAGLFLPGGKKVGITAREFPLAVIYSKRKRENDGLSLNVGQKEREGRAELFAT